MKTLVLRTLTGAAGATGIGAGMLLDVDLKSFGAGGKMKNLEFTVFAAGATFFTIAKAIACKDEKRNQT